MSFPENTPLDGNDIPYIENLSPDERVSLWSIETPDGWTDHESRRQAYHSLKSLVDTFPQEVMDYGVRQYGSFNGEDIGLPTVVEGSVEYCVNSFENGEDHDAYASLYFIEPHEGEPYQGSIEGKRVDEYIFIFKKRIVNGEEDFDLTSYDFVIPNPNSSGVTPELVEKMSAVLKALSANPDAVKAENE